MKQAKNYPHITVNTTSKVWKYVVFSISEGMNKRVIKSRTRKAAETHKHHMREFNYIIDSLVLIDKS